MSKKWKRVLLTSVGITLASFSVWYAIRPPRTASREKIEATLTPCIGLPARDVLHRLGIEEAKRHWNDEPPGKLRGVSYYTADGRSVRLYLAKGEPLYRQINMGRHWDYSSFLDSHIGRIQYESHSIDVEIGP